ncbi:hypothetical protein [Methylomagnum sp.]
MTRYLIIPMVLFLAGCGVDAVGTAAVNANAKAREIEQAQKLKEEVKQQFEEATALERRRLEEMDAAMENGRGEANQ